MTNVTTFQLYSDPAHGWLKITRADALALGFTAKDFSRYSYVNDYFIYLEEDADATKFIAAFKAKHGENAIRIRETVCARRSKIRGYRRNGED